jgi:hypothetical protein
LLTFIALCIQTYTFQTWFWSLISVFVRSLFVSVTSEIVYMVRIQLAWLVECGRFRECLGNNPGGQKWKHQIGRMTYRTYSSGWFPVKKLHFGVSRHCTINCKFSVTIGCMVLYANPVSSLTESRPGYCKGVYWCKHMQESHQRTERILRYDNIQLSTL